MPKYRKKPVVVEWVEETEQLVSDKPLDINTMSLKTTMTVPLWGYFPVSPPPTRK